jgi:hypothetical protein
MSQQGPIVVVSKREDEALTSAINQIKSFPLVDVAWPDVIDAIARLKPAAVLVTDTGSDATALLRVAQQIDRMQPYVPMIAIDPAMALPANVISFTQSSRNPERLVSRLNAALRVRTLHATMLRRMTDKAAARTRMPDNDPIEDATVLLIGRGASYPALSVALGEQMGVVGALSIEAAAKHLNARELDGIIVGEGFSGRVVDAFLTVLSEDTRFRNLPVVVSAATGLIADYDLPNLEITIGDPRTVAASAVPLIRQHAFEARIDRALKSIDAGGLLDPRTGLLTKEAFDRDFDGAIADTQARGAGLSVACISFTAGAAPERARLDAARILSRLMRRMDFATLDGNDAILIVFPETDLRNAQTIARRLGSVLKHTMHSPNREQRLDPQVMLTTLLPYDTATSILARLHEEGRRAAAS